MNVAIEGDPDARGPLATGMFQRVENTESTLKEVLSRLGDIERTFLGDDTWDQPGVIRQMRRLQLSNAQLTESNKEVSLEIAALRNQNRWMIVLFVILFLVAMFGTPLALLLVLGSPLAS